MRKRGIIQVDAFEKMLEEGNPIDLAIVFKAITFEAWCQMFLDGRMPK